LHPEILDDLYLANAVNIANIAAWCRRPLLRQRLFTRNGGRIGLLVERRKQFFTQVIGQNEHNAVTVDYALSQIRRLEHFHDEIDLLFRPSAIILSLDVLASQTQQLPYGEMASLLLDIGSISEAITTSHGIKLADGEDSLVNQGSAVEKAIQPYLAWVDSWESYR
jgi:hypothetical protein